MSNNKQSSVEWLISQLTEVDYNCINKTFLQSNNSLAGYKMRELFEQAKAMHKEECKESYYESLLSNFQTFEEYYNETFNNNE